jgi:hypothetical protein
VPDANDPDTDAAAQQPRVGNACPVTGESRYGTFPAEVGEPGDQVFERGAGLLAHIKRHATSLLLQGLPS